MSHYEIRFLQGDDLWLGGETGWYIAEIEKTGPEEEIGDTFGPFENEAETKLALENNDFGDDGWPEDEKPEPFLSLDEVSAEFAVVIEECPLD